uniref:Uncharacterized protein n=1 Tax=Glossina austeni TaxID=7395 RepID=A0A1A9VF23_GLOAU
MKKNDKSSKNNRLFARSEGGESNNGRVVRKIQSRNPFFHYLNAYRKTVRNYPRSIWSITAEAAKRWNEMPMREKCIYIEKARHAGYIYHLRDPCMQLVLGQLRKALAKNQTTLNIPEMAATIELIQLWKRQALTGASETDKKSKNIKRHFRRQRNIKSPRASQVPVRVDYEVDESKLSRGLGAFI